MLYLHTFKQHFVLYIIAFQKIICQKSLEHLSDIRIVLTSWISEVQVPTRLMSCSPASDAVMSLHKAWRAGGGRPEELHQRQSSVSGLQGQTVKATNQYFHHKFKTFLLFHEYERGGHRT